MPGHSNKTMNRKSATQELNTEFFNTDSENANPKKTPPELNYSTEVNLSSCSDQVNVTVDSEYECQSQEKSATQDSDGLLNDCRQIYPTQDTGNVTSDSENECQSQSECTQDIGNESEYIFKPSHKTNPDYPLSQYISQYRSQDISQDIHLPGPSTQKEDDGDDSETTANSSSDTVIVSDTQNETERLSQYVLGEPTQYQSQDIFPQTLSQPSQNLERSDRRKSHVNYLHSSDESSSSSDQDFAPVESESPALITRQKAMYIPKPVVPEKRNIECTESEDEFPPPKKK